MTKMEKIKAVKADKPAGRDAIKARRVEKVAKASTVTFTIEPAVRRFMDAQAKATGLNLTHYMQKLVESHVIEAALSDDPLALRLAGKRHVIDQAVALAVKLDAAGKFDDHFILSVVQEAGKDPAFVANYDAAIGGKETEGTRAAARARVSLNQQIGRVIKKSVGARSKRNEAGKIIRAQVQHAMIVTYTLLEKPS